MYLVLEYKCAFLKGDGWMLCFMSMVFADVFSFSIIGIYRFLLNNFLLFFFLNKMYNILCFDTVSAFNESNLSHKTLSKFLLILAYSYI